MTTTLFLFDKRIKPVATRIRHAAHYGYNHPAKGHDLEQIDVTSAERPAAAGGFEYAFGYLGKKGEQHWVFSRRASFSPGRCVDCTPVGQAVR